MEGFERIAVAVYNNKGGVGKTTISSILVQIALERGLQVVAADREQQHNLTRTIRLILQNDTSGQFRKLCENLTLTKEIENAGDVIVIDCSPALGSKASDAMEFADVVLVPVTADMYALSNLERVYKLAEKLGKRPEQLAIVMNGLDKKSVVADSIRYMIRKSGLPVAGSVPMHGMIPQNVLLGKMWHYGLPASYRRGFYDLFEATIGAYSIFREGDFEGAWPDWWATHEDNDFSSEGESDVAES